MKAIISSLWRIKFWHQFLIGSVIPYIRIHDFSKNLMLKSNEMMQDYEQRQKRYRNPQIVGAKRGPISQKHQPHK
nr:hypothetical protein [Flavobacterium piscinae]